MLNEKLKKFAELLESDQIESLYERDLGCMANIQNRKVETVDGKKYIRVNIGDSGRYMIDKATEEIFGIKAYGVIHRGYRFGTLDTINNYWWGQYRAIKRNQAREIDHLLTAEEEIAYKEQEQQQQSNVISLAAYKRAKAI